MGELESLRTQEHFIPVRKTARVVTLGGSLPSEGGDTAPEVPQEIWIVCHGYRQLASRFIRRFQGIASPTRLIVAPEGLSRFYLDSDGGRHGPNNRVGATWMTREDRENEISDYVAYLDDVARSFSPGSDHRTVAFGFSQGVHTACRWALYGQTPVDRLILWGAYVPPDLDLIEHAERWRGIQVTQVHGDADPTRSDTLQERQAEQLAEAQCPIELRTHPGGHIVETATLAALAGV